MSQEFVDGFIDRMRSQLAPISTGKDEFAKRCPLVEIDGFNYRMVSEEKIDPDGSLSFTLWSIPKIVFAYFQDQGVTTEEDMVEKFVEVDRESSKCMKGHVCVLSNIQRGTNLVAVSTPIDLDSHIGWVTERINRCISHIGGSNSFDFEFTFHKDEESETFNKLFPRNNASWTESGSWDFGNWGISTGRVTLLKSLEK